MNQCCVYKLCDSYDSYVFATDQPIAKTHPLDLVIHLLLAKVS